jgi:hypothetical protein
MSPMHHNEDIPAELARLADGTLPPGRRAALEARVASSPELQALLAEQQRVRAAIAGVATPAPAALRARIEALRPERGRRARFAIAGALATAAAALILALALPSGTPAGPSLSQAATLTALPPTKPAPGPHNGTDALLNVAIGGVRFPAWADAFGWQASGVRSDEIKGRDAVTVFYDKGGRRIGYTIVDGDALDVPDGAAPTQRNGLELHTLIANGRTVVTWERMGHTCILSGDGVAAERMVELAAWTGGGTVPYN